MGYNAPSARSGLAGGVFLWLDRDLQSSECGVLHMSTIPSYWYVETDLGGETFEKLPWRIVGPTPVYGPVLVLDADGVIYGQAILMGTLPWPRFRRFLDGKEVHLPFRAAVALKELETGREAAKQEWTCECGGVQPFDAPSHYRVEVRDQGGQSVAVTRWCNCHFEFSYSVRKCNCRAGGKPALRYADVKGASGKRSLQAR